MPEEKCSARLPIWIGTGSEAVILSEVLRFETAAGTFPPRRRLGWNADAQAMADESNTIRSISAVGSKQEAETPFDHLVLTVDIHSFSSVREFDVQFAVRGLAVQFREFSSVQRVQRVQRVQSVRVEFSLEFPCVCLLDRVIHVGGQEEVEQREGQRADGAGGVGLAPAAPEDSSSIGPARCGF